MPNLTPDQLAIVAEGEAYDAAHPEEALDPGLDPRFWDPGKLVYVFTNPDGTRVVAVSGEPPVVFNA